MEGEKEESPRADRAGGSLPLLAAGPGRLLAPFADAWLGAGGAGLHLLRTDESPPPDATRASGALPSDADAAEALRAEDLRTRPADILRRYRTFVCLSASGSASELSKLREWEAACRAAGTAFLPAVVLGSVGLAGPLSLPGGEPGWTSAWRQLSRRWLDERAAPPGDGDGDDSLAPLLANAAALAALRLQTEAEVPELLGRLYVLDLDSGEGSWRELAPHPLASGTPAARRLALASIDGDPPVDEEDPASPLLLAFARWTSPICGLFREWEEGDLRQLPLAQCRATVADPLADGPAEPLTSIVAAAFGHVEARREAGLAGLEAYAARLSGRIVFPAAAEGEPPGGDGFVGIGAGATVAEAACRGLLACLGDELDRTRADPAFSFRVPATAGLPADDRCRFYLEALGLLRKAPPRIGWSRLYGLPVAWAEGYAAVGLNETLALRAALLRALQAAQNGENGERAMRWRTEAADPADLREDPMDRLSASAAGETHAGLWLSALARLERHGRQAELVDLPFPRLDDGRPAKIVGVRLRGGSAACPA